MAIITDPRDVHPNDLHCFCGLRADGKHHGLALRAGTGAGYTYKLPIPWDDARATSAGATS